MTDKPTKKRIVVRTKADKKAEPSLSVVGGRRSVSETKVAGQPVRISRSGVKRLESLAEISTPEKLLSIPVSDVKNSSADEKRPYILSDSVSEKAVIFQASNGSLWLLKSDELKPEEVEDLAYTEGKVKTSGKPFTIAIVPDALFKEFHAQLKEQHRRKLSAAPSDQHVQFESLVEDAVSNGVSDIHITVARGKVTVEYRIDSRNVEITKFSWSISVEQTFKFLRSVFNTITQATEDGFNSRVPQDASIIHPIKGKNYQLRYAHDNVEGEGIHAVLRVLDDLSDGSENAEGSFVPLTKLGLYEDEESLINRMMEAPYGFLCVSGTTGSGKSTMLKNIIGGYAYRSPGKNIITVENPVEYRIYNAKQTSVSSPDKMAAHLVSALRRDPDCILIGEIRDRESAKVTVEATQTGHFVWSTLHASNALAQISRLEDIGISRLTLAAPEFIAGMLHLALARKVCTHCRIHIKDAYQRDLIAKDRFERVKKAVNHQIDNVYVANTKGCSKCSDLSDGSKPDVNAGFKGRMSVPEMVVPNMKILNAIKKGDDLAAYEAWRESGGITIQESAVRRLKDGFICANEIEAQFKRLDHDEAFYI
ncbi:GspE/PulE family protein [Marinobacter sp.]|uniref:GspE/PulE family protein n=1 Tax=Marinobacter sp. TaxID=50741 RepID=UPI0035629987